MDSKSTEEILPDEAVNGTMKQVMTLPHTYEILDSQSNIVDYTGHSGVALLNSSVPGMCQGIPANLKAPIIMGLCGVLGNLLALYVLYNTKTEMKRSSFYTLVAGLALTDLLGQLLTAPFAVTAYASGFVFFSEFSIACKVHGFLMVGFGLVTPLIVCLMALERVGALCCTYFCSQFLTKARIRTALVACWVFSMGFAATPFLGFGEFELQFPCSWCFLKFHGDRDGSKDLTLTNVVFSCFYAVINLVVISITVISNIIVAAVLLQARKRRQKLTNNMPSQSSARFKGEQKRITLRRGSGKQDHSLEIQMVWLLCGMTLVFTCCWTPFMYRILTVVATRSTNDPTGDLMAVRAAAFNQILDPWVYILVRRSLFLRIKSMFKRLFGWPSDGGCGGRSTTTAHASFLMNRNQNQLRKELLSLEERSPGLVLNVLQAENAVEPNPTPNRTRNTVVPLVHKTRKTKIRKHCEKGQWKNANKAGHSASKSGEASDKDCRKKLSGKKTQHDEVKGLMHDIKTDKNLHDLSGPEMTDDSFKTCPMASTPAKNDKKTTLNPKADPERKCEDGMWRNSVKSERFQDCLSGPENGYVTNRPKNESHALQGDVSRESDAGKEGVDE